MKKKRWIVLAVIAAFGIAVGIAATSGLSQGKDVQLQGINLSGKPDGDYTGVYDFKRWSNTLTVHVKDHKLTGIDIVHDVDGAEITHCSGEVFQRVIDAQDTNVDVVSGATVTSKAYLKAIENALN